MTKTDIYDSVLTLTPDERSELIAFLIQSLETEKESDLDDAKKTWDAEIKRRVDSVRNGTAELIPEEEVWKELFEDSDDES
jgi:putative addiction module component (TIGR02574 family)